MKIEIWSDIVCPFCYIGKRKLETALADFAHRDEIEIIYKSYELDPKANVYSGENFYEVFAAKFGISVEQAKQNTDGVKQHAAASGLTFNFENMKQTNTFDAHRLVKWAEQHGKAAAMLEALYYAFFTASQNVSDPNTLANIAESVGLNKTEASNIVQDKSQFAEDVREDEAMAKHLGIQGVPFFVFDQKYAISGAQPVEIFTKTLQKAWEEAHPTPSFKMVDADQTVDAACSEDGCAIPPRQP